MIDEKQNNQKKRILIYSQNYRKNSSSGSPLKKPKQLHQCKMQTFFSKKSTNPIILNESQGPKINSFDKIDLCCIGFVGLDPL